MKTFNEWMGDKEKVYVDYIGGRYEMNYVDGRPLAHTHDEQEVERIARKHNLKIVWVSKPGKSMPPIDDSGEPTSIEKWKKSGEHHL